MGGWGGMGLWMDFDYSILLGGLVLLFCLKDFEHSLVLTDLDFGTLVIRLFEWTLNIQLC